MAIRSRQIKIMYTGAIYHANYDCFRNLIQATMMISGRQVELHIYTAQTVEQLSAQGMRRKSACPFPCSLQSNPEEQHKADILFLPIAFESPIPEVLRTSHQAKWANTLPAADPF